MKKRILAFVLLLALALTLAPAAWAAPADESKFDGHYRPDPTGKAVYLGMGSDGVMEFEITLPVGGDAWMPLARDSAIHFSAGSSDKNVVDFYTTQQYYGKAPGSALLDYSGYINSPEATRLWARVQVTVLSKEDYDAYRNVTPVQAGEAHAHDWRRQSTLPTCGTEGQLIQKCALCGEEELLKTLDKIPHVYAYSYDKVKNENVFTCPYCGDRYTVPVSTDPNPGTTGPVDPSQPHTHSYTSAVTRQPTAKQEGVRTYTCSCGDSYTEAIPAKGLITTGTDISKTANSGPVKSNNINAQHYDTWFNTIESYLYQNEAGGLTRVEYTGSKVVVEDYDSSFKLLSSWSTQAELPLWGGFYAGEDYNFLIFGQKNEEESPDKEVIRVVQYTKDWRRIKSASLYGANTKEPFAFGTLRCTEYGGYLYVRTCHVMFKSPDGANHQANVMLSILQSDMTIADAHYIVGNSGYVSHSFNQVVLVDESGHMVTVDHGDAYPRALIVNQYAADTATGQFTKARTQQEKILSFPGKVGDNATGCSLGGFEETSGGYVAAYSYDGVGTGKGNRDIYLSFTDKELSSTSVVKLSAGMKVATPQMVSTGLDGGYVLWNEQGGKGYTDAAVGGTLYYTAYNAAGQAGPVKTAAAPLSDCKPILYNGRLVWYVTSGAEPVFYTLDATGVSSVNTAPVKEKPAFADVPATEWFYDDIQQAYQDKVLGGTSYNAATGVRKFSPYGTLTLAEFTAIVTRGFYASEIGPANGGVWYNPNVTVADRHGLLNGVGPRNMDAPVNRFQMAQIMLNVLRDRGENLPGASELSQTTARIPDWNQVPAAYADAVSVCYSLGLLQGKDSSGTFNGAATMRRCECAAVYIRLRDRLGAPNG